MLRLEWLGDDGAPLQAQTWRQASNPVNATSDGVDGYEAIDVPYTGCYWGGLERGTSGRALLDGSVDVGFWFYAVGAIIAYDGLMPGPCIGTTRLSVRVTELHAYLETSPPPL